MDWLNIHTSTLDSPAFVGSGPVERSSWLCLLRFCIGQENGGRIADAKAWKDRQWQQLARVTLREVMAKSQLWTWEGNDLVVSFYPTSKESEVKARREVARRNGMLGGRPNLTQVATDTLTHEEPTSVNSGKAEGEWKGNGKEGEEELKLGESAAPSAPAPKPKASKAPEKTDDEWRAELAADPTYAGISIAIEWGKMARWCEVNRKQPTRKRFINWIGRIERPAGQVIGTPVKAFVSPEPPNWRAIIDREFPTSTYAGITTPWAKLSVSDRDCIAQAIQPYLPAA